MTSTIFDTVRSTTVRTTEQRELTRSVRNWAVALVVVILALLTASFLSQGTSFWYLAVSFVVLGGIYLVPASACLGSIFVLTRDAARMGDELCNELRLENSELVRRLAEIKRMVHRSTAVACRSYTLLENIELRKRLQEYAASVELAPDHTHTEFDEEIATILSLKKED